MKASVLLIDDDLDLNRVIQFQLEELGYKVTTALNGLDGLEKFKQKVPEIVITDLQMPGMGGMELVDEIRKNNKEVIIIIITAHGSIEHAVKACQSGANEYITKPFGIEELTFIIEKTLRFRELEFQNINLKSEIKEKYNYDNIISNNSAMKELFQLIGRVAKSDSTILILGESGTGKELIARAIHNKSVRKENNFVPVNCAAIPDALIESELFGHTRGAFTGAYKERIGKFEIANKGTIFLDEIGDLNYEIQAKLLRVLQEGEIERIGESVTRKVDTRVIAATNKDLKKMISDNKFREDLFYRINVIPIKLPPLRERKSDIPLLVEHFKLKYAQRRNLIFSDDVIKELQNYDWPGNIRELENLIERISVLVYEGEVQLKDLPLIKHKEDQRDFSLEIPEEGISLQRIEGKAIQMALERSNNNQTQAAKFLKIPRHILVYRMKKFGLLN